jgi:hypothetical protein
MLRKQVLSTRLILLLNLNTDTKIPLNLSGIFNKLIDMAIK